MPDFSDILLTVDYDRTLTAPDSTVPARNMEAIRYFMEHGGTFTINTGRSVPMARPLLGKIPVNAPLLLYNGSAAFDTETERLDFCHLIPLPMQETIEETIALFPDLTVEVQGVDAHYCFSENKPWDDFSQHNNCAWKHAATSDDIGPFLKFSLYGELRDVTVASLYDASEEEMQRMNQVEQMLKDRYGTFCEVFRAAPRIIDVHTKGVSKARSARELQQRLGKKWLVCVGDAHNDLQMLTEADFAFVPADAILADRFANVCPCGEGAVADVIYEKIPEILANNP